MVQLKITAQKRGDGKGDADNASNKGGPTKSSLAAASALNNAVSPPGRTPSLKLQSKGKGSTKAGSRNKDVASLLSGHTDNKSRGGGKAAGSTNMPESTQKKEATKGRNMGDDRVSSISK